MSDFFYQTLTYNFDDPQGHFHLGNVKSSSNVHLLLYSSGRSYFG